MKLTNIIILLVFVFTCKAQTNNLDTIRKEYLETIQSEARIIQLLNTCEKYKDNSTISAYKTVAKLMLIEYDNNPLTKLKLFTKYTKKLDSIVTNNINNLEIRFLRFCTQKQTPRFLGYNDNLELDYKFIIQNIDIQSKELQEYINPALKKLK
jgi:hypothetical protein|tara:strand:+ start:369 stop:827 length:459 start_codon:yes stop_codon:yes gene_type:complete